jgi:4-hydroxybenzoyl-CoA thioesterase
MVRPPLDRTRREPEVDMAFRSGQIVRFHDIDRAGIVYYPRFFDYIHRTFEDFCEAEVGIPHHKVIDELKVGFPVVHIESDFHHPLQHGDRITVEMPCARLGRSSMTMRYRLFRPGTTEPAAEAAITTACVNLANVKPIPIPDQVRAACQKHLAP